MASSSSFLSILTVLVVTQLPASLQSEMTSTLDSFRQGENLKLDPDSEVFLPARNCTEFNEDCSPWMKCDTATSHTCQCKNFNHINDIVKCDEETGSLSVLSCYCATYDNETGQVTAGACIENCMNFDMLSIYHGLTPNPSMMNDFFCRKKFNRGGTLCGKCLPGYMPLAYSFNMSCVNCTNGNRNIWKYLSVALIPLTCFYYIVVFFRINATSSHLHGFVIFSQAIATPAFGRIMMLFIQNKNITLQLTVKILAAFYGFCNLDFFRMLIPGICLDLSTLSILALDYVIAVYPLLLTILSYILIELHDRNFKLLVFVWKPFGFIFTLFQRKWDIRTSVIDAYATFCLLSFCKIISTSFDILIPTYAYNLANMSKNEPKLVLYYNGTMEFFGKDHLPYAILAIVMLILFGVLPICLMFVYPCRCFRFLLNRCHIRRHVLHTFMDSFQGCYKDGTEPGTWDCRWFAGLYLLLRILMLSVFSFTHSSLFFPLSMTTLLLALIVIINVQPNRAIVGHYNKINVTFISLLALDYAALISADIANAKAEFFVNGCYILASLVGITPLIYMTCIFIHWIVSRRRSGTKILNRVRQWLRKCIYFLTP